MTKPHKYAEVIIAWANGLPVLHRYQYPYGEWSPWTLVDKEDMRFTNRLNHEYKVADTPEPGKWQREREAYLAGAMVEFRGRDKLDWKTVDSWLIGECARDGHGPIWERDWLEFRIANDAVTIPVRMTFGINNQGKPVPIILRDGTPNLTLTFEGDSLAKARAVN